ncbi:helix-turn-helix domain-containing protein [Prevotella sp. oral taxon 376]|uniref:helix-turn-helix domain-containing protein n=1 Tax=Prevotella sp. oral taxon 376 TaxID=712466 RepID=UPI001304A208|nr:helix-turn-helix domain-containing protein [Prevotella sp. oral taxon 376]
MASEETYLTTRQTAAVLNVSEKTVRRYVRDCIIPFTKPRGRYYFAKSQLIAFINNEL